MQISVTVPDSVYAEDGPDVRVTLSVEVSDYVYDSKAIEKTIENAKARVLAAFSASPKLTMRRNW